MTTTVRRLVAVLVAIGLVATPAAWREPSAPRAQGVDVFLNITAGGATRLNIAVPEFTVVAGADTTGAAKTVSSVIGSDLTFTGLFSVVAATGTIPANDPAALKKSWAEFAAAGAHAAVHGLLAIRGARVEGEMRLYDLTTPEYRLIASKTFNVARDQPRRLAHKIADHIVLQFTGEPGIADTKLAYVQGPHGQKEIQVADYDGSGARAVTRNGSINLTPAWSPDARSIAFTSYRNGYPDLFRTFPFEQRPDQMLAAFAGINSSPAWSPDNRSLAMTLSKDGSPEIYVLNLATGVFRRLTHHPSIDTDPTWSPSGRQIAFVSDRGGTAAIYVMDVDGTNVHRLTSGGFRTQPRWSPKGDVIAFTARQGTFNIWLVGADGSNPRRLTNGPGDSQGATWAPNGRYLAFQSNRLGPWQIFAMRIDGSNPVLVTHGAVERTSPSWSPRLP